MTGEATFVPMHVAHSAALVVPAPLAEAFALFTPEGERRWVPGWAPEYLHPVTGECRVGTVFRTAHGGEETLWLVLDYDPGAGRAGYARITPGSRIGTVTVQAQSAGPAQTRVTVRYELTSLSRAGSEQLAALTAEAYAAMIGEWERKTAACVAAGTGDGA